MNLKQQKEFLTTQRTEYSFFAKKNVIRKTKLYKWDILSPTIFYTIDPRNCEKLPEIEKSFNISKKQLSDEIIEKYKDNIEVQKAVLEMIRKRNEQFHYRCGLIKLTTGKGKSMVVIDIVNYYKADTLVLVHNIATLNEMVEKFEKFTSGDFTIWVYGDWSKSLWNITICTKNSFVKKFDSIKKESNFDVIICDEAEQGFSKDFWEAMNSFCHPRKWIAFYWLTGTPKRDNLSTQDLEKYFGKIIEVQGQENNWYNIVPNFTFYDYYTDKIYEYEAPHEMRECLEQDEDRIATLSKTAYFFSLAKKCTLIMTDRKTEISSIYNYLQEKILSSGGFIFQMTGDTKTQDDEQNKILAEKFVQEGKKVVIIATIQKAWRWVDIPFIDGIFLAAAIKFEGTVIQAVGRALRKYPWKSTAEVSVWNDMNMYPAQRRERKSAILQEYPIKHADIKEIKIGKRWWVFFKQPQ